MFSLITRNVWNKQKHTFFAPNILKVASTRRETPVIDNADPIMSAFEASFVPSSNIPISGRLYNYKKYKTFNQDKRPVSEYC